MRGRQAERRGLHAEAARLYGEAVARDRANFRAWAGLARAREDMGDHGAAAAALEQGLLLAPNEPSLLYRAGALDLGKRGRPDAARPRLERLLRLAPDHLAVLLAVGAARAATGDLAGAEDALKAAERAAPQDPDVAYNLGVFYADAARRPLEAARAFRRYLKLGGSDVERTTSWIRELDPLGETAPRDAEENR
ncbi:MAG TPA: tetratricopeptide repeat protein [Planctomycetota bacterium]|nr:tetratricopeptide repeat protein [Planctomycetota bacterium]